MRRWLWKLGLFLLAWLAVAGETGFTAGWSLIVLLFLWAAVRLVLRVGAQLLAQVGLDNWWAIASAVTWITLFLWLVPETVPSRLAAMALVSVGLIMAGAGLHVLHERQPRARPVIRDIALAVGALALIACPAFTWMRGDGFADGLWLLAALALLLGIPLAFGWRFVHRAAPRSAEAKLGDPADLRGAGLGDER